MFDRIEFIVSEAFQALRRHPILTIAAISTVSVALFLIGAFAYAYYRVDNYAKSLPGQMDVRVFIKDEVAHEGEQELGEQLNKLDGILSVSYISKEAAWQKMGEENPEIPVDLENPLPDAYNLTFKTVGDASKAVKVISDMPEVEKVLYEQNLLNFVSNTLQLLRYVGYFGLLLLAIGATIIYNTIRLTIHARGKEIRIMQLVGASNLTIQMPFMLEGAVQGLTGGVVAAIILQSCNGALSNYTRALHLLLPAFPGLMMLAILGLAGTILGTACSAIALRLPMKSA